MFTKRTEWEGSLEGRQKWRLVQLCHPSRDFRRTRGWGAGFTSTRMRNDSWAEGNSAKKPISHLAQLFRLCERAPERRWERGRESEKERIQASRAPTEGKTVSVKISAGSFDQYFNERIIGINGLYRLSDLAPISNQKARSAVSRFLAFCLDGTA